MQAVTLGILAHVDAGKTSLTERLLYDAGAIPRLGRVDDGTTRTDAHELERLRGITIRTAVATFTAGGHRVHLVDTPGHPDFIAEVERALSILDGAVLVVSATAGVQPQTTVLLRALTRLRVPTLIFVNKTDRSCDRAGLLAALRTLTPVAVDAADPDPEPLADLDDDLLAEYVADSLTPQRIHRVLTEQTRRGRAYPVYFGSAVTGAGVPALVDGIRRFLPATDQTDKADQADQTDHANPLRATVFGIERDPAGRRVAYLRLRSGTIAVRQEFTGYHGETPYRARITAVEGDRTRLAAGDVARVWGLAEARIGDHLGTPEPAGTATFPPPALASTVTPSEGTDPARLHAALRELADQDPLIGLRTGADGALSVRVHGQVQREVIAARLRAEFGVVARFAPIRPVCVERLAGTGTAEHRIDPRGGTELWATVGLRLTPGPPESGVRYRLGVQSGLLPRAFYAAIEESVHAAARRGPHGWEVVDFTAELTAAGYASPVSTAGDFRTLTTRLVTAALHRAGTVVCAPVSRFTLELPPDTVPAVLAALARRGATVTAATADTLTGTLPTAQVQALQEKLPALTHGAGALRTEQAGYR